jgi:plastocyanin
MKTRLLAPAPLLFLLAALPCAAADHVVVFADAFPPNHISPVALTIAPGDTVTFKSIGNNEFHNAHADDDSFRCAEGCRGSGGASGDPSRRDWSDTLTFTTPGIISYHCDEHPGAVATITVSAPGQAIVPGISGNWFDPTANQGGHGFQLEVLPDNGMLAIWFVFNPAGTAQNWIFMQGSYDPASNTATLPAFLEQGGAFLPNFDAGKVSVTPWGSLQFTFTDCDNGNATWKSNAASFAAGYGDVSFPIRRVTQLAGVACP